MTTTAHEELLAPLSRLKDERGWTDTLIAKFLGEPDKLKRNPHYRNAAPMRLYDLARVEAIESSPAFSAEMAKTSQRRKTARKAVATRIQNMTEAMKTAEITIIKGKTRKELKQLALETHGGNYMGEPGAFYFNDRVAINCIRHNLTNYEELWEMCNRGTTGHEAYNTLRQRTDALIQRHYPEYFPVPEIEPR